LPLALRIAAADLAANDSMAIAEKVEQLGDDRLGELAVPGDPTAAVSVVFDESYASLPEQARLLFRHLGLLPGADFTANDAAVVADIAKPRRLLDQLVGTHLVERRGDRYALHDLLKVYARERCKAEEVDQAMMRLYDFYRRMTDDAAELLFPDQRRFPLNTTSTQLPEVVLKTSDEAFAWMAAEHTNLLATARVAAERGDHWPTNEIGAVLNGFYYEVRDDTNWSALCDIRERASRASGDATLVADTELGASAYQFCQGDYAKARELAQSALDRITPVGNPTIRASAHNILAALARVAGEYDTAVEHQHSSLAAYEETGSVEGQAVVLMSIATVDFHRSELLAAGSNLRRALELTSSPGLRSHAHNSLTSVSLELGRLQDAIAHHEAHIELQNQLGNTRRDPIGAAGWARAKLALGEADAAFDRVLDLLEQNRIAISYEEEISTWTVLADLLDAQDAHEDAVEVGRLVLRLSQARGYVSEEISGHLATARASRRLGDFTAAAHHLGRMRALMADQALPGGEELRERALLHLALGEVHEAVLVAEQAVERHRRYHQRYLQAQALQALAAARQAAGDVEGAAAARAEAEEAREECGVR
jgi:tetratricopeptide (TPR) repeat protein